MIFTTEYQGLHYPINTPSGRLEMHLINQQRIERWRELQTRSGNTPNGSPHAADHSRSLVGRVFYSLANLFGLAAWFGGIFAVTYIVGALMSVPEPETREFTRADGTSYERTQREWHIESPNARSGGQED